MDIAKIAARVAADPEEAQSGDTAMQVDFSLHGMVSVNVRIDPSWLGEDEELLPQYREQVKKIASQKAHRLLEGVPDNVQWQLEEM